MPTAFAIDFPPQQVFSRERFQVDLESYAAQSRTLWYAVGAEMPDLGACFDHRHQRRAEAGAERLFDRLEREIERTRDRDTLARQQSGRRAEIAAFAVEHLGLEPAQVELMQSEGWLRATSEFARSRRELVPEVAEDDLYQALRNAWIAGVLQQQLGRSVELGPAIFGYSMLYPLTDNPLDDPRLGREQKRTAGARLGRRLGGAALLAHDATEAAVFRMVGMIESQYPRELFPAVWAALAAIHRAQLASLAQQEGVVSPYERDVLGLSIGKGGASVLVDGYLASGALESDQAAACFTFGVLLQLLDDLQDTREDLRAGRATLFTQTARGWKLDALTAKLWGYARRLLGSEELFTRPANGVMTSLVERGVAWLLLSAVAEQPELFTREFRRHLEGFSPVSFAYLRSERRRLAKRQQRVRRVLARRGILGSVWEMVG